MKIFFKGLNPCAARRVNLLQYKDYLVEKGYEVTDIPQEADYILIWGRGFRKDYSILNNIQCETILCCFC